MTGHLRSRLCGRMHLNLLLGGILITTLIYQMISYDKLTRKIQKRNTKLKDSDLFDLYGAHPFENECRYPINRNTMPDINNTELAPHIRDVVCDPKYPAMAVMDSEGYIYVNTEYYNWPSISNSSKCSAFPTGGGFRPHAADFHDKKELPLEPYRRVLVNSDVFIVRCYFTNGSVSFERAFIGLRDLEKEEDMLYYVDETPGLDEFGRKSMEEKEKKRESAQKEEEEEKREQLSVHILTFDSTSRTQFYRHMPRTTELMERLGFHQLFGYSKIGDNSEINLVSLLAGDLPEAALHSRLENVSNSINRDWILPRNMSLDPDLLQFLWKEMQAKGCATMLNDEIGCRKRGLFHYDSWMFMPGFTKRPTDHYFRTFYDKWLSLTGNRPQFCYHGDLLHRYFMDVWRRFANKYKEQCAFGFSFVTTLTHDHSYSLELLDDDLKRNLENLHTNGAMDNGVFIIMGDHGQRIHKIQKTYSGRIEERAPMFSIYFPQWFKEKYADEYQTFLNNRFTYTSNFDLHQTLKDIVRMNFGKKRKPNEGRGFSLFTPVTKTRNCSEAFVSSCFCTCLIDRSDVLEPLPGIFVDRQTQAENSVKCLSDWLIEHGFTATEANSVQMTSNMTVWGLNNYARSGLREMIVEKDVRMATGRKHIMDYNTLEFTASFLSSSEYSIDILVRIDHYVKNDEYLMHFEPMVLHGVGDCNEKYLHLLRQCLDN